MKKKVTLMLIGLLFLNLSVVKTQNTLSAESYSYSNFQSIFSIKPFKVKEKNERETARLKGKQEFQHDLPCIIFVFLDKNDGKFYLKRYRTGKELTADFKRMKGRILKFNQYQEPYDAKYITVICKDDGTSSQMFELHLVPGKTKRNSWKNAREKAKDKGYTSFPTFATRGC